MYKRNNDIRQTELFDNELLSLLPSNIRAKFDETKYAYFYKYIVCQIDEDIFKGLYKSEKGAPNIPINTLVGALTYKNLNNLSINELFEQITYNVALRLALGLKDMNGNPFCKASSYNFMNKVEDYDKENKTNLFENVFNKLTVQQIKRLGIKTDMQRIDSVQLGSNVAQYSRLGLLVEVAQRMYETLNQEDKGKTSSLIGEFADQGSQKYVYTVEPSEVGSKTQKLGAVYSEMIKMFSEQYADTPEMVNLKRVFSEHFYTTKNGGRVGCIGDNELDANNLQSPDDVTASYHKKNGAGTVGYVATGMETCNPSNPIQLVTDVAIACNTTSDSDILESRLNGMLERTPDLKHISADGGFGSEGVDLKLDKIKVEMVQTAVKGVTNPIDISIEAETCQDQASELTYTVYCPMQQAEISSVKKGFKASFLQIKCLACPLNNECSIYKNKSILYFKHKDYLKNKRHKSFKRQPKEFQQLRNNVEATMKEMKKVARNTKVKVRGISRVTAEVILTVIGINFGRIHRYMSSMMYNPGRLQGKPVFLKFILKLQLLFSAQPREVSCFCLKSDLQMRAFLFDSRRVAFFRGF